MGLGRIRGLSSIVRQFCRSRFFQGPAGLIGPGLALTVAVTLVLTMALQLAFMAPASAQTYQFSRIEVQGNQRIRTGTIATYAGIERGQQISAGDLNDAYQRIQGSGLFETVELIPRGSVLVVQVTEYPTINRIGFEGNRRLKDDALEQLVTVRERRVFSPEQAERDAATIAEAMAQQGRISATVTPRIIRRSDNRVDLIFEIAEGGTAEIERISFVGNRAFSDRRLRQVLETKQANLLRAFVSSDTLLEGRIEFDRRVLTDFYQSRGYVDFRVLATNVELTRERDALFLVVNVEEGQQFRFGEIRTTSNVAQANAEDFQRALRIRPGVVYSPTLIENSITRMERLAVDKGIDFLRIEPKITRNDRDLTLNVEFLLTRGPRVFVERIDIEGNTTTLDRVVRQQFRIVEGDPFNPREVRESAERVRALGYFADANVQTRAGSASDQVIVDVDVQEQPTGSLNLGGSYSVNEGFGLAIGLTEDNFLGRGQRVSVDIGTTQESEVYTFGFVEPYLLGRDLRLGLDFGVNFTESSFASYNTDTRFFNPTLNFPVSEAGRLTVGYSYVAAEMRARDDVNSGNVIANEIALGRQVQSALTFKYTYDSRLIGLNPNTGLLLELGADVGGLGGDSEFLRANVKTVAQTRVLNEELVLRATFEAGAMFWDGANPSRTVDRFILNPSRLRGFEPGGIGPRDQSNGLNEALGGNYFAVARFEAEFPLGAPEELGLRGGVFYDVGNLWDLDNANLTGGSIVGSGDARHVIGVSLLWTTGFGPLRFNFSKALQKEDYDNEQSFDLTLQARF